MRTNIWSESMTETGHLKDLGDDERIMLKYNLKKSVWKVWTGFSLAQDRDQWSILWRLTGTLDYVQSEDAM
jgi:hypothetical protein